MRGVPGRRRLASVIAVVCSGLVVAVGCVGTTDREDFDRIIQERGGGLTSELVVDAVDAVAARLRVDDFAVRSMTVTAPAETVVLEVRDPAVPENLDRYLVRGGAVDSVEPVRVSAGEDLDRETFPVSSVALDRVEAMVDGALAEFGRDDGYVSSMTVNRPTDGAVVVTLSLASSRASGTATFTGEGELVQVAPT